MTMKVTEIEDIQSLARSAERKLERLEEASREIGDTLQRLTLALAEQKRRVQHEQAESQKPRFNLTRTWLMIEGACESARKQFDELFSGAAAEITLENIRRADDAGLPLQWLVEKLADKTGIQKPSFDHSSVREGCTGCEQYHKWLFETLTDPGNARRMRLTRI